MINGKELATALESKMIDLSGGQDKVYCGIFFMKAGRNHMVVRQRGESFVQKDLIKYM